MHLAWPKKRPSLAPDQPIGIGPRSPHQLQSLASLTYTSRSDSQITQEHPQATGVSWFLFSSFSFLSFPVSSLRFLETTTASGSSHSFPFSPQQRWKRRCTLSLFPSLSWLLSLSFSAISILSYRTSSFTTLVPLSRRKRTQLLIHLQVHSLACIPFLTT